MIHYPTLKKEVLVALRGKLSRSHCSQKMGFSFNKVQRWESTTAEIDWLEFIDLSRACRKDFSQSFKKNLGFHEDLKNYSSLLRKMIAEKDIDLVSKQMSIPKASLRAWLQGKRVPKLIYMLQILHEFQRVLVDIIEDVIELDKVPSLRSEILHQKKLRDFHHQHPATAGIVALLDTVHFNQNQAYQEGSISRFFGLSLLEERTWVKNALELGLITREGNQLKLAPKLSVDTQSTDYVAHARIKEFWIHKTVERLRELQAPDPFDRFGYLVFSGSQELVKEIHAEYYAFYQRLKTLIQSQDGRKPADTVCIINTQIQIKLTDPQFDQK